MKIKPGVLICCFGLLIGFGILFDLSIAELTGETRVNGYITGKQQFPAIAMDANGNYVITWESQYGDGSGYGIYARRYDSSGTLIGGGFRVNTSTSNDQYNPSVAMDPYGNFVIAWVSQYVDPDSSSGVMAQRFDSDGNGVGPEFHVNATTGGIQDEPSVAMDASGNFVIVWRSFESTQGHIYAQLYDSSGSVVKSEFRVNTHIISDKDYPYVAMDPSGNFVVAWGSRGQDYWDNSLGIYAQRYDSAGNPIGLEFQVNTHVPNDQSIPSIGIDSSGNFVIAWQSSGQDGSSKGVFAQRYDNTGAPLGLEFQVNAETTFDQDHPSVAMNPNGEFIIAWESYNQIWQYEEVYFQRFDSFGNPVGLEEIVNASTDNFQEWPVVALAPNGNAVFAWQSNHPGSDDYDVYMRLDIVDQDGDGVRDEDDNCQAEPNADQIDTDGDCPVPPYTVDPSCGDLCDNCPSDSNPDQADSDDDLYGDACDVCPEVADDQTDTDADGVGDACDVCPEVFDNQADTDTDGYGDACDVCPGVADDQTDSDADGFGDTCDVCPGFDDGLDADNDGVPDGCDLCTGDDASGDTDGDGICDADDPCPGDAGNDADGDGFCISEGDCDDNNFSVNPAADDATCDGLDNDCDGATDEDYVTTTTSCGVGACAAEGTLTCSGGAEVDSCIEGAPAADDATCDGIDDDCDGGVDEDYVSDTSCFLPGECAASNAGSTCVAGVETTCSTGTPAADDATCDGLDNDCDGATDEDYVETATTCGVGACAAEGTLTCSGGAEVDSCIEGAPAADDTTCDGIDDDCDGGVDEDYVSDTSCFLPGECAASNAGSTCVAGVETTCSTGTPAADDATCDGLDNDCDGATDEGYVTTTTSCGVGACAAEGTLTCSGGAEVDSCIEGTPAADDATCDGIDDDCDGGVDEDYVSDTSCFLPGECAASNAGSTCVAGVETTCSTGTPAADDATCDGLDNDCDGATDEDYVTTTTSCGVGACAAEGTLTCSGGAEVDSCIEGAPAADDATCDGIDDDCDGGVDEDYVSDTSCFLPGECAASNAGSTCVAGVETTCSTGTPAADDATCDGLDNDCDGATDEDYVETATTCGVGACAAEGTLTCSGGAEVDSCIEGAPAADDTTCDGIDDDCDGGVDEDYVSDTSCFLPGECAASNAGSTCVAGVETTCSTGTPAADDATCDGLDNDCDGATDEDCGGGGEPLEITAPIDPLTVNSLVIVSIPFNNEHTVIWDWDNGATSTGVISADGLSWEGSHTYSEAGIYTIVVTIKDAIGNIVGSAEYHYIVIFDPNGNFVTGGGWIMSPEGAYSANLTLTGKANFGFVSKYKKGTNIPTGQTEFQFQVADLNFHSDSYDWLVVAGPQANFKGVGKINNSGNYGFMISALDSAINGGDDNDKFRIKIWDKGNNDSVVYDNLMDAPDDAEPTTVLGGGSIVIHKKNKK